MRMNENPEDNLEQDSSVINPSSGQKFTDDFNVVDTDQPDKGDRFWRLIKFSVVFDEAIRTNCQIVNRDQLHVGAVYSVAKNENGGLICLGYVEQGYAKADAELFVVGLQMALPVNVLGTNLRLDEIPDRIPANSLPRAELTYSANTETSSVPRVASLAPPVASEFEGIAANGGAVAAVALGVWTIFGSMLTHWAAINGIMGFVLGIWGLSSKRPRLAWLGIILCIIGVLMIATSVNDMINKIWIEEPSIDI